jgi:hypothetical protein
LFSKQLGFETLAPVHQVAITTDQVVVFCAHTLSCAQLIMELLVLELPILDGGQQFAVPFLEALNGGLVVVQKRWPRFMDSSQHLLPVQVC